MQNKKIKNNPLIIAHRGVSAEAEENTLTAFQKAIDLKVDFAELDIRLSKDEIPIVFHDPTLARRFGLNSGPSIDKLTLLELKNIDDANQSDKKEKIPTLGEVLNLDWHETGLMIEIKKCKQEDVIVVQSVFKALNKALKLPRKILIGSFSVGIIDAVLKLKGEINADVEIIGILEKPEMIFPFIERGIKKLAIYHKLIDQNSIVHLNKENIEVFVFTVNTFRKASMLHAIGVKGIITNNPRVMTF